MKKEFKNHEIFHKLVLFLCVILSIGLYVIIFLGFFNNQKSEETIIILNDRQKQILKENDLPTDYESLTLSQKSAIESIEQLLVYLEKKYPNDNFSYKGYVASNPLEKEHLIANSKYGEVTVYREYKDKKEIFSDDYKDVKYSNIYSSYFNEYLLKYIDDKNFIISVKIHDIDYGTSEEKILNNSNMSITLFVNELVGKDKFDEIITNLSTYVKNERGKNKMITVSFHFVKQEDFSLDLIDNYESYDYHDSFIEEKIYSITKDGDERFY